MSTIYNNKNYSVVKGQVELPESKTGEGYHLINNVTGVREFEGFCLPQILELAEMWDNKLQSDFHKNYTFRPDDSAQMELVGGEPVQTH